MWGKVPARAGNPRILYRSLTGIEIIGCFMVESWRLDSCSVRFHRTHSKNASASPTGIRNNVVRCMVRSSASIPGSSKIALPRQPIWIKKTLQSIKRGKTNDKVFIKNFPG